MSTPDPSPAEAIRIRAFRMFAAEQFPPPQRESFTKTCDAGYHRECSGVAWSMSADRPCPCACECHREVRASGWTS